MKLKLFHLALTTVTLLTAKAEILTVDNRPGAVAMFSNFSDAHEVAEAGDTVIISGSPIPYGNNQRVLKPIAIIGSGRTFNEDGRPNTTTQTQINLVFDASESSSATGSTASGISGTQIVGVPQITFSDCDISVLFTAEGNQGGHTFRRCNVGSRESFAQNTFYENCLVFPSRSAPGPLTFKNCWVSPDGNQSQPSWTYENCIVNLFADDSTRINSIAVGGTNSSTFRNVFKEEFEGVAKFQLDRENNGNPAVGDSQILDLGPFGGVNPITINRIPDTPRVLQLAVGSTVTSTSGLRIQLEAISGSSE